MKINEVTHIEYASLGKRFLSFFFDVVITLFIGLGIFVGTSNVISSFDSVKQMKVNYNQMIDESGLTISNEKEIEYVKFTSYEEAVDKIYNFYSVYLPKYTNANPCTKEWFNCFVLGLDDVNNLYEKSTLDARSSAVKAGKELFEYRMSGDAALTDQIGIPKSLNQGSVPFDSLEKSEQTKILNYFNDLEAKTKPVLYTCIEKISEIDSLNKEMNSYIFWNTTIPLIGGIFISYCAFFFVIPLCLKNGKTLGKMFLKISVISADFYSVKKGQIVLRYLPQILIFLIGILFLGTNIVTISIATIAVLISYLMAIFKQDHQSIHDMVAGTFVISDTESVWFKNKEDENIAIKEREQIVG